MIKKFILLLAALSTLVGCYNQERDCTDFKTGNFEFETYLNGEVVKTTFTRNDTLEIDFYQGQADSSNIRWINDCEYQNSFYRYSKKVIDLCRYGSCAC